jgi:hypothetical protein
MAARDLLCDNRTRQAAWDWDMLAGEAQSWLDTRWYKAGRDNHAGF